MTKHTFEVHDTVSYRRQDKEGHEIGATVFGFVDRVSETCVYIFNTATGKIVAAPANRVFKV